MSLSAEWPLRKICELHETNDVLLDSGVGDSASSTRGKERFLELIDSRTAEYDSKDRFARPVIAVEILKQWRSQQPPGRFVVQEPDSHPPLFKDVGDKKARACISGLLKRRSGKNNNSLDDGIGASGQDPIHPGQTRQPQRERSKDLDWKFVASKLYEREDHAGTLMAAFDRSRQAGNANQAEIVLICGPSGSGKSELARSIEEFVTKEGGFFLWGKFEQFGSETKAYSAFFSAFQRFIRLLEVREESWKQKLSAAVHASVGTEVQILAEAMPFLGSFLKVEKHSLVATQTGQTSDTSRQRFMVAFSRLVRAIRNPQHPIVLVLDDLQWADVGSLDLLVALASAQFGNRQGILMVGTCRGNEVSLNDPLSVRLRALEEQGTIVTNIEVANLSVDSLTQMIVDAGMPLDKGSMLAEIVHSQTRGNAFFSTQYIQNLQDEGLLKRESSDAEWEFQADELELSSREAGYDNQMVRLLAKKMMQLPHEVQDVLKVAACIGGEVREDLLFHACSVSSSTVLLALCVAEERGLIFYNFDSCVGRFSHDRSQEAAVSLIPTEQLPAFQLQIGRTLRSQLPEQEFSDSLPLIASLLVKGMDHVESEDEREKLARLCLAAARKTAKASAFSSSVQYIEFGLTLLTKRHWRDQYDLSMLLYSTGCELAYCNGDHDMVKRLATEVVDNARSFNDKVRVYTSLVLSLDSKWEFEEAADLCFNILDHCGEHFPRKVGKTAMLIDFWKTRQMLRGKTAQDILNLPVMTDTNALTAMSIIHLLYPIVLFSNFELTPLTAFRLVRLTLRHGQSPISSVGFAFYASTLVRLERVNEGIFYGNLALELMKRHSVKQFKARTNFALWGNVLTETEPLSKCLGPFMASHHASLSTGDLNVAMAAFFCHCMLRFCMGADSLESVAGSLVYATQLCKDYNQRPLQQLTLPVLQACYNLMGRSEDLVVLTGEVRTEDQWKASSRVVEEQVLFYNVSIKLFEAIYMDTHVKNLLKEYQKRNRGIFIPYFSKYYRFFQGLAEAGETSSLSRWRARRHLRYLEHAMVRCPENFTNKVFFIKAELAASSGQSDYAMLAFDKAIHYAEKEGLLSEKALACEKAARMLLSSGRASEATTYLAKAIKYYAEWGAVVKVVQMRQIIANEKLDVVDMKV